MQKKATTISSVIGYTNPFFTVNEEQFELPNGTTGTYYAIRDLQTAFIVPMPDADTIIITKQFRYLFNDWSWEFPAGRVDPGEEPLQAAVRELQEEAGVIAGKLEYAGWFAPCNGLTAEKSYVYFATDLTYVEQELEDTEILEVVKMSVDEFEAMINNNQAKDGMSITAWRLVQQLRSAHFNS